MDRVRWGMVVAGLVGCGAALPLWSDGACRSTINPDNTGARGMAAPVNGGAFHCGFEAGMDPSLRIRFRADHYAGEPSLDALDPRPSITVGGALRGERALRLSMPQKVRVLVTTPAVRIPGGRQLHVGLRADRRITAVARLRRSEVTGGNAYAPRAETLVERAVALDGSWTRIDLSTEKGGAVFAEIECDGPVALDLDELHLAAFRPEAAATVAGGGPAGMRAPDPAAHIESMVAAVRVADGEECVGVVQPGRAATIDVALSRPMEPGEQIAVRVIDRAGRVLSTSSLGPSACRVGGPTASVVCAASFATSRRGPQQLEAHWMAAGGRALAHAERRFVALPPPPAIELSQARIGTHARLDLPHVLLARRLGFRWLRMHDATMVGQWLVVEPTAGMREYHDAQVWTARGAGLGLLGVLEATPQWAAAGDPQIGWYAARTRPPRVQAAWASYVGDVTSHYGDQVEAWEVWNEPYLRQFFDGTPAEYASLLQSAHGAAPHGRLLVSAGIGDEGLPWTRAAVPGIASERALAFHLYDRRLVDRAPPVADYVASLRALAPRASIWLTEGSVLGASTPRDDDENADVAESALVAWAADALSAGVERVFVYSLTESEYDSDADLALLDPDGTPRPAAAALSTFIERSAGRTPVGAEEIDGVRLHRFAAAPGQSDDLLLVAASRPVRLDARCAALDRYGNPIEGRALHLAYVSIPSGQQSAPWIERCVNR